MRFIQELPPIHSSSRLIHIMRIPCENRPQNLRVEIQCCLESGRVVKTEIGPEPIYHSRLDHYDEVFEKIAIDDLENRFHFHFQ
jgi:hypothetical protein